MYPPFYDLREERYDPVFNPLLQCWTYAWITDDGDGVEWLTAPVWQYRYRQRQAARGRSSREPSTRSLSPARDRDEQAADIEGDALRRSIATMVADDAIERDAVQAGDAIEHDAEQAATHVKGDQADDAIERDAEQAAMHVEGDAEQADDAIEHDAEQADAAANVEGDAEQAAKSDEGNSTAGGLASRSAERDAAEHADAAANDEGIAVQPSERGAAIDVDDSAPFMEAAIDVEDSNADV
ncbi:unnamed protein product [Prorocentrum cordatum]|uniref:Uncharacterized protein n=1 Tax=Prorocentrum cordatum TaxID=2364126 RepID=A0ABN9RC19_9DINO|nr:unnamed protein product [Polarella glacialis]